MMNVSETAMESSFSADYGQARMKFVEAARAEGGQLQRITHPARGPDGAELSMDIAWFGDRSASKVLLAFSGVHGVEAHGGRVAALFVLHDVDAEAVAPDGELLDRGGAECVAGAEEHLPVGGEKVGAELADRRRLADTVDADDEDDPRAAFRPVERRRSRRFEQGFRLLLERAADGIPVGTRLFADAAALVVDELVGRGDADIGAVEGFVQAFEQWMERMAPTVAVAVVR